MAVPHRRHRTSLESVIVPEPQHLTAEEHGKAIELFNTIIHYFEPLQESTKEYKPITLVRLTKEEISVKDEFLLLFFTFIERDRFGISEDEQKKICLAETVSNMQNFQRWTNEERHALGHSLVKFAMYLIDNFFLPRMSLHAYLHNGILTLPSQSIGHKDSSTYASICFSTYVVRTSYWHPATCL